jgi:hypothetical protein
MWRRRHGGIVTAMPTTTTLTTPSAARLHEQLQQLQRERALAALTGLSANALYMADLFDEIDATRAAYVGAAVTEIASLRAEIDGPLAG